MLPEMRLQFITELKIEIVQILLSMSPRVVLLRELTIFIKFCNLFYCILETLLIGQTFRSID
jgi:hypothetical protein